MPYPYSRRRTYGRSQNPNRYPIAGGGSYYRPRARPRVVSGQGAYKIRPYRPRLAGRGAYTVNDGPWANRGASIGGAIGERYAGSVGRSVGSWIGRRAFHYPAKLFGSGSYGITDQVDRLAPQVPVFEKGEDDSVVICHREYIGDIITSSSANTFKIDNFALNPSEIGTFPWLNNLAQPNYQQFKFDGLVFEFKSFSADALNSTNTALGSVFAAINYDYSDTSLSSRYEVENMDWSMACKPSEHMMIPVECKPRQTSLGGLLYVVNGNNVPTGADPKMYYLGKLFIGTTGFQGTSVNIGSLYVTYKIRLYKAFMSRPLSNGLVSTIIRTGVDNTNFLGTSTFASTYSCDTLGLTFTGTTMTISKKRLLIKDRFMVMLQYVGTAAANLVPPAIALSSGLVMLTFSTTSAGGTYGSNVISSPMNTGITDKQVTSFSMLQVNDNSVDQVITYSAATLPTSGSLMIYIWQVCSLQTENVGTYVPS